MCQFCGDKWDRDHKQKCKVWGKLNAIFSSQDQETIDIQSKSDKDHDNDLIKCSLDLVKDADVC